MRIANVLHARFPVVPWRFDAATYEVAAARAPGPPLRGRTVEACWDPELAAAMQRVGRAVEEEAVIDALLTDLDQERQRSVAPQSRIEALERSGTPHT